MKKLTAISIAPFGLFLLAVSALLGVPAGTNDELRRNLALIQWLLLLFALPTIGVSFLVAGTKLMTASASVRARINWRLVRWLTLFLYIAFYLAYVTIPFYGSGIHLMSESQIYMANNERNLAEWYPLFRGAGYVCRSGAYTASMFLFALFPPIIIPLFSVSLWRLPVDWRTTFAVGKAWRVALIIVIVVLLYLQFHESSRQIGAWLFD
jgi:hypothetical protein